jgi:hypothetical protein
MLPGMAWADLVQNGGFETGDFSGWAITGACAGVGATTPGGCYGVDINPGPHTGNYAAYLGGTPNTLIAQTLMTTVGQEYTLNFFLAAPPFAALGGYDPNSFSVSWNGTALDTLTNLHADTYGGHTYSAIGTGSDILQFTTSSGPSYFLLDDVSVSSVPDGGVTFMLLGGALVGFETLRRKFRA